MLVAEIHGCSRNTGLDPKNHFLNFTNEIFSVAELKSPETLLWKSITCQLLWHERYVSLCVCVCVCVHRGMLELVYITAFLSRKHKTGITSN